MNELFLIVWMISSNCSYSDRWCSPDHEIKSQITTSKSEASRLYAEHKDSAKVFKVEPWGFEDHCPNGVIKRSSPLNEGCVSFKKETKVTEQTVTPAYEFEDVPESKITACCKEKFGCEGLDIEPCEDRK